MHSLLTSRKLDASFSLFNFSDVLCIFLLLFNKLLYWYIFNLQIHKQANRTQNSLQIKRGIKMYSLQNLVIFPPRLISNTESSAQCPQSMAGTASLAAAPGGAAAAAAAPSAGSVPPPLGAPLPGGGPDGASPGPSNGRETEPAEANEPHTRHAGAVDARPLHSSDTFVTSS